MTPLLTIGYESATHGAFLDTLRHAGVELLVDVRAVAASRRAGFSKRQLTAGVAEIGTGYVHLRDLGTPPDGRLAARSGRHDEMRRIFAAHLATDAAQAGLDELAAMVAGGRRCCLLCFERDPAHCHRSLVADAISARLGAPVQHLVA